MTEGADPNRGSDAATTLELSRFPRLSRVHVSVGTVVSQLSHARGWTVLAVLDIALAILAATFLAGMGIGVIQTGQQQFDVVGHGVWVAGGPIRFSLIGVDDFENSTVGAHGLDAELEACGDMKIATPMLSQMVYVRSNESDYETPVSVGAPARGGSVQITNDPGLSRLDTYYASGNYTGPMTHEATIGQRTAKMMNVSVGGSLYVGGTTGIARENELTVIGAPPTFSRSLGMPSVVVHLSELREVTGSTSAGTTALMALTVADGVDPEAIVVDIQANYPDYDVRTNQEQPTEILYGQAIVMVADGSLASLAFLTGPALSVSILLSRIYHRERELAALKVLDTSSSTPLLMLIVQMLVLDMFDDLSGVALSFPATVGLNRLAQLLVGFGDVVVLPRTVPAGSSIIAFVMSLVSSLVASRQIAGIRPLDHL